MHQQNTAHQPRAAGFITKHQTQTGRSDMPSYYAMVEQDLVVDSQLCRIRQVSRVVARYANILAILLHSIRHSNDIFAIVRTLLVHFFFDYLQV